MLNDFVILVLTSQVYMQWASEFNVKNVVFCVFRWKEKKNDKSYFIGKVVCYPNTIFPPRFLSAIHKNCMNGCLLKLNQAYLK